MVSEQDCRRIAAEASLDVRTVRRVLAGAQSRSLVTVKAIQAAMIKLEIEAAPLTAAGKKKKR